MAAASEAGASLVSVPLEIPDFQAYCGLEPPQFQNEAELECAKILDYYAIPWEYEPRTFVLEQDEEGRIAEAFTPDFYLPERFPHVNVKLFYKRDIERLARRYRLVLAS